MNQYLFTPSDESGRRGVTLLAPGLDHHSGVAKAIRDLIADLAEAMETV